MKTDILRASRSRQVPRHPFDTRYFPEQTVRDAVGGCCHDFALALHRRTGWMLACIWKDQIPDRFTICSRPVPSHMFCIMPDGRGVDAEGVADISDILGRYDDQSRPNRQRLETYEDESAYREAVQRLEDEDFDAHVLRPREHGIKAADAVIADSREFLELVDSLRDLTPASSLALAAL
jgi:hypothetical protein